MLLVVKRRFFLFREKIFDSEKKYSIIKIIFTNDTFRLIGHNDKKSDVVSKNLERGRLELVPAWSHKPNNASSNLAPAIGRLVVEVNSVRMGCLVKL